MPYVFFFLHFFIETWGFSQIYTWWHFSSHVPLQFLWNWNNIPIISVPIISPEITTNIMYPLYVYIGYIIIFLGTSFLAEMWQLSPHKSWKGLVACPSSFPRSSRSSQCFQCNANVYTFIIRILRMHFLFFFSKYDDFSRFCFKFWNFICIEYTFFLIIYTGN